MGSLGTYICNALHVYTPHSVYRVDEQDIHTMHICIESRWKVISAVCRCRSNGSSPTYRAMLKILFRRILVNYSCIDAITFVLNICLCLGLGGFLHSEVPRLYCLYPAYPNATPYIDCASIKTLEREQNWRENGDHRTGSRSTWDKSE
jgi:hypothetical protein